MACHNLRSANVTGGTSHLPDTFAFAEDTTPLAAAAALAAALQQVAAEQSTNESVDTALAVVEAARKVCQSAIEAEATTQMMVPEFGAQQPHYNGAEQTLGWHAHSATSKSPGAAVPVRTGGCKFVGQGPSRQRWDITTARFAAGNSPTKATNLPLTASTMGSTSAATTDAQVAAEQHMGLHRAAATIDQLMHECQQQLTALRAAAGSPNLHTSGRSKHKVVSDIQQQLQLLQQCKQDLQWRLQVVEAGGQALSSGVGTDVSDCAAQAASGKLTAKRSAVVPAQSEASRAGYTTGSGGSLQTKPILPGHVHSSKHEFGASGPETRHKTSQDGNALLASSLDGWLASTQQQQ